MLPCARSCIGEKLKSLPAVCVSSPRTEPLLFLYPRWFQETIQPLSRLETRSRPYSTRSILRRDGGYATTGGSRRVQLENQASNSDISHQADESRSTHFRFLGEHSPDAKPDARTDLLSTSLSHRPLAVRERKQPLNYVSASNPGPSSVSVSRRPLGLRKNRNIDIFALAEQLSHLQSRAVSEGDTISLNASFLSWLTGTSGENIWKHHDGSGCLVHVKPSIDPFSPDREVVLSGTERAREVARQNLKNLEAQHLGSNLSSVRNEIDGDKSLNSNVHLRVDQIARPNAWTLRSFYEYVRRVVSARTVRGIERKLYPGNESLNATVARVLLEVFDDPLTYHSQSSFALRQVLDFCSTRTDMGRSATMIWSAARKAGIVPDVSCYNFELERCLAITDGYGAKQLIDDMGTTQIDPNPSTWACLFRALKTTGDQVRFLRKPEARSALFKDTPRDVIVQGLVDTLFEPSDSESHSVASFCRLMNTTFYENWFSPPVIQSMIEKCSEKRAFRAISIVLELAHRSRIEVTQKASIPLMRAVCDSGWFEDVIKLLKLFKWSQRDPLLDQAQTEIVFEEAWKQQLPNVCRVIWHYAASHGSIRFKMLISVAKELTQNVHASKEVQVRICARMAAVIVGVEQAAALNLTPSSSSKEHDDQGVIPHLVHWTPMGVQRHNQMQLAHGLLEQDLTSWRRISPMSREMFLKLLDEAFALDIRWQQEDTLATVSVLELVHKAVSIKLEQLDPVEVLPENIESQSNTASETEDITSLYQTHSSSNEHVRHPHSNSGSNEHSTYDEDLKKSKGMTFQPFA